jgi:hypothetical protein
MTMDRKIYGLVIRSGRTPFEQNLSAGRDRRAYLAQKEVPQSDIKLCFECGCDHFYESGRAYNAHMDLIAEKVRKICIVFANSIAHVRVNALSATAIHTQVKEALRSSHATVDPQAVIDKVKRALESEGYKIRED